MTLSRDRSTVSTHAILETYTPVSNDGKQAIEFEVPYAIAVTIQGTAPFLFHRWSVEAVAEKAKAAKGSKAKKQDDVESYVYRRGDGNLAIPGEYLRQAMIHAAKFKQDPRSPRKSAMDLFKGGLVSLSDLCSLGTREWDYLDQRRVTVQRNSVTRTRPAMRSGWRIEIDLQCLLPEYISPDLAHEVATMAGRLIGLGDFRPTYGRFQIVQWGVTPCGQ